MDIILENEEPYTNRRLGISSVLLAGNVLIKLLAMLLKVEYHWLLSIAVDYR